MSMISRLPSLRPCVSRGVLSVRSCRLQHTNAQTLALQTLVHRNMIENCFPTTLVERREGGEKIHISNEVIKLPAVIYAGFDPTGPSLHLGHLLVVNSLLYLAASGYKVIFLVGSGTAQLGDPSGRSNDRIDQQSSTIRENGAQVRAQLSNLIQNFQSYILPDLQGQSTVSANELDCVIEDNSEWYDSLNVVDFLREAGPAMRVGTMLKRRHIRERMQPGAPGLPLHEFVYQALQCYDWLELHKKHNCHMQLGGSDQLAHLDAGYHFLKHHLPKESMMPAGFMTQLMLDADGHKIGKSAANGRGVYLSAKLTDPFSFYQHLRQVQDSSLYGLMRQLTFWPIDHVDQIYNDHVQSPKGWSAQQKLADAVTLLVHGPSVLTAVQKVSQVLFACRNKPSKLQSVPSDQIQLANQVLPTVTLSKSQSQTRTMADLVLQFSGEGTTSLSSVAHDINNGALHINEQKCTDGHVCLLYDQFVLPQSNHTLLRMGQRTFALIEWTD